MNKKLNDIKSKSVISRVAAKRILKMGLSGEKQSSILGDNLKDARDIF